MVRLNFLAQNIAIELINFELDMFLIGMTLLNGSEDTLRKYSLQDRRKLK